MKNLAILTTLLMISLHTTARELKFQQLPAGMVYQLQFGPYQDDMESTLDNLVSPLTYKADASGAFIYRGGIYHSAYEASLDLNHLRFEGVDQIEVVAFFNGQPVSLSDAAAFEDNRNQLESAYVEGRLTIPEELPPGSFYYTITVVVDRFDQVDRLFDFAAETPFTITRQGPERYSIGRITNQSEAIGLRLALARHGIKDAAITSFYQEREVSIYLAEILERKSMNQLGMK